MWQYFHIFWSENNENCVIFVKLGWNYFRNFNYRVQCPLLIVPSPSQIQNFGDIMSDLTWRIYSHWRNEKLKVLISCQKCNRHTFGPGPSPTQSPKTMRVGQRVTKICSEWSQFLNNYAGFMCTLHMPSVFSILSGELQHHFHSDSKPPSATKRSCRAFHMTNRILCQEHETLLKLNFSQLMECFNVDLSDTCSWTSKQKCTCEKVMKKRLRCWYEFSFTSKDFWIDCQIREILCQQSISRLSHTFQDNNQLINVI